MPKQVHKGQTQLMQARIPMGYMGQQLDRGQVFEAGDAPNFKKLLDMRYMEPFEYSTEDLLECNKCGAKFVSEGYRLGHGKLRHTPMTEMQEDAAYDRLLAELQSAPPVGPRETINVR